MTSPTKLCMIIRNIFVVLVIYDYFSVVVCQCRHDSISVPSCPRSTHEWSLKATELCTMKDEYHCLITENHNEDKPDLIECCMPYKNISKGHMPRYNTIKTTIQEIACDHGYYMTTTFASNRYRLNGVEHCHYKKSACVMEGMKIYDNGSTTEDRKCYCDYKNNFKPDLSLDPNVVYFYEKDNHCSMSECDLEFHEMNTMYQCVNVCKDGEYRPERSMDCIPKSSTTIPPVVVSINGSTAGVEIKTTLETTTKSTPENIIDRKVTTEDIVLITVLVVGVVLLGLLAILIYKVIKKKSKDGNCCVYFGNITNFHAQNIISGDGNMIQVNGDPEENIPVMKVAGDPEENIPLMKVAGDPEENIPLMKVAVSPSNTEEVPLMEVVVPVIKLKQHTFTVSEGRSVTIECKNISYEENYHPHFWERIHENDETNKLTIREDKEGKYLGLERDPPCLTILNAEMSDGGDYCCCIEYSTSNGEETVRSKKAHLIVEKEKPGDTYIEKLVKIKANNITADIIYVGGDEKNITVKNKSEDKKEKANISVGSSSSSSSENSASSSSSENASSSENETSLNIDKTEQGTQNSDCGQETGDVDINQEKKSKLKPVSVTEQGSDENNIKGNSINEDTEEKMNTLKGSNPLSANKMSNNCDEIKKGTHNSDCGNETGDVGVNKVEKSNMKPVSVTGKKNISVSDIERIAGEHGFSVENVCGDGNCMFHAIALQLKSKIGEEKSKKLRCNIVEFLKNNDTTPAAEKYSSFLSSVHENERESEWSKYLASMSKPGTYGDEIVLRAVSHCFNVRIDVLSTASPERFITYNSPDNSEDSTVYLGFIDKLSHYVRLQPKSSGNQGPYTSRDESSV